MAARPRWVLLTLLLLALLSMLLVRAYVNAQFAPDHSGTSEGYSDRVPAAVHNGGPIIDAGRGQPRSFRLPAKTIALTFDDGPDPKWTPRILEVLRRHQVHATFFVVGSQVARHPGLTRKVVAGGHEIGVHTFTHADLAELPEWRRNLEYAQTQLAIAGATGLTTSLLRFPYSSTARALDNTDWQLVREAAGEGYISVLSETDSKDWIRPSTEAIVRASTPDGDRGAVVLMHDAGGDRSQTLTALDALIPRMRAAGYNFVTVSEGLNRALSGGSQKAGTVGGSQKAGTVGGSQKAGTVGGSQKAGPAGDDRAAPPVAFSGNVAAGTGDRWRGRALVAAVFIAGGFFRAVEVLFLVVGLLTLARLLLLFAFAGWHTRRRRHRNWSWGPPVTEPVSVIVPAYNEKEGIEAAVRSLATGDYPEIEVVVVDDGSTDGTADLAEGLGLPNVRVVRVPNGGKPAALNAGLAFARYDLIVMVDGDTVFERDSIRRLVQPFADQRIGAVAGNVKVGNRDSVVARWQHIEYVIGFNLDRRLYDILHCMPTVPGAIGAFRRQALREVGGVSDETLAEDTDLTMALCRAGWWVVYEERARAWTEAPATLGQLWTQRYRWSYGTMQAMWKHRSALVERGKSGRFGRRGLLFLALFSVALPVFAPLFDILTLYALCFSGRHTTVAAWLAMLAAQAITAVVSFRLDRERLTPLWTLPLQQFVYRQMMYAVIIQSMFTALAGVRLRWHKLRRTGQAGAAAGARL